MKNARRSEEPASAVSAVIRAQMAFNFDPPNTPKMANYRFPSAASVVGRCLGALLRGESLTDADCRSRFASNRLAHHVWSLTQHFRWPVNSVENHVVTGDAGRAAVIARYSISENVINEAGEAGRQYALKTAEIEAVRRGRRN